MKEILIVGLGGFLGAISRYGVSLFSLKMLLDKAFFGTLFVNILGSLLLGFLVGYANKLNHVTFIFFAVGVCGGFTTFSTFSAESIKLLREGLYLPFALYISISVVGGLLFCALGHFLGTKI